MIPEHPLYKISKVMGWTVSTSSSRNSITQKMTWDVKVLYEKGGPFMVITGRAETEIAALNAVVARLQGIMTEFR